MTIDNSLIYLDHAAATPCDPAVMRVMQPYMTEHFYNPSSPYAPAVSVAADYQSAKHRIATCFGGKPNDIIMTAGATESINLAFTAAIGGHVVSSKIEHHAVLESARAYDHTFVDVDKHGIIDLDQLKAAIKPETKLVSVALANNEIGTIQPIKQIGQIIEIERNRRMDNGDKTPIWFHSDGSQGVGQLDINVARLGVDMLTLNAAKCYGPKQVGLLWRNSMIKLSPIVSGGGQELGLRSGTENVAGAIGFAQAIKQVTSGHKSESKRLSELKYMLTARITSQFADVIISGHPKKQLPGFLHLAFPGLDAERLVFRLENRGVLVATGSACAANSGSRSHVLSAIGMSDTEADGSLRITLGKLSNQHNIERAAEIICTEIAAETDRIKK